MITNPYNPTRESAALLGHQKVAQRIVKQFSQPTPPHVSVVGPKYSGKSTLLRGVATILSKNKELFWAVVHWEFRSNPPQTDAEFKTQLGQKLREKLREHDHETARDLVQYLLTSPDDIETVFDEVRSVGKRIVVVFDDHDRAIEQEGLTENLWGYMENLANNPNVSFLASSALPLAEVGFNRDVQNSPYWRKYDPIIPLQGFDSEDWISFFEPFNRNSLSIDEAAKKEVANWSGGVPALAAELTRPLFARAQTQTVIGKTDVDAVAETILQDGNCQGRLRSLWRDLGPVSQSHFSDASENRAKVSEWSNERLDSLVQRGLVVRQGAGVKANCRLLAQWSKTHANASGLLREAFGKTDDYVANFGALLQLRLAQITPLDSELRKCVTKVLENLDSPEMALSGLRAVFDEAMRCLWAAETENTHYAPQAWRVRINDRLNPDGKLPATGVDRGTECHILDQVTGKQGLPSITRYATKPTFILAQCIKSSGDFLNHKGGVLVTSAFAFAVCLVAVELCESLARDLERTN